jgi:hypothetical protein
MIPRENRFPTPEEWVDEFLAQTREQQVEMAGRIIANCEAAAACFVMDHRGRIRSLERRISDAGIVG